MSGFSEQGSGQYIVVEKSVMDKDQVSGRVELFLEDGTPFAPSAVQKRDVTIPTEWLLANTALPEEGVSPTSFEVLPSHSGRTYVVIAAFAKLVFKTTPYVLNDIGLSLFLDYRVLPLSDAAEFPPLFESDTPASFWRSEANNVAIFSRTPSVPSDVVGQPIYFYAYGEEPLTEGDSDLELSLYYVSDNS